MTVSSALLFHGAVDFPRFEAALQIVSSACPWLFCSLRISGDEVSCVSREEGDEDTTSDNKPFPGYFRCEFIISDSAFDASLDVNTILPARVHEKMIRVELAMASV